MLTDSRPVYLILTVRRCYNVCDVKLLALHRRMLRIGTPP